MQSQFFNIIFIRKNKQEHFKINIFRKTYNNSFGLFKGKWTHVINSQIHSITIHFWHQESKECSWDSIINSKRSLSFCTLFHLYRKASNKIYQICVLLIEDLGTFWACPFSSRFLWFLTSQSKTDLEVVFDSLNHYSSHVTYHPLKVSILKQNPKSSKLQRLQKTDQVWISFLNYIQ